jgi:hypothetical protein
LVQDKALLVEENRWLKQQLFGRSSEKRSAPVPANQKLLSIFIEWPIANQPHAIGD